jgi:spore maturation protein CgeB
LKKDILYQYDLKFYAQKKFAQDKNEYWLPLAVDPETYKPIQCVLKYDVAFCGTFIAKRSQAKRNACLKALTNEFMKGQIELYIGRDYNEYAGLRYNEARFVFNMGIAGDINMRFFEAAVAGVPQFYTEVDGLKELGFEPDVHYIGFTDEKDLIKNMFLTLNQNVLDPSKMPMEKANEIRKAAAKLVMEKHTYDHRVREMIRIIHENITKNT